MQPGRLTVFLFVATTVVTALSQTPTPAQPQPQAAQSAWHMQESGTLASLRGIDSVDGLVAWTSGSEGTVLRTVDGGAHWLRCSVPDGAKDGATLDFRGVQAWDARTAIVMASGPGDKSRLYKTRDGCAHWTLLYSNPDKAGFWDAMAFSGADRGFILGDPVAGRFVLLFTLNQGKTWNHVNTQDLDSGQEKIGAFAASNSAMTLDASGYPLFGTSGPDGPWLYYPDVQCTALLSAAADPATCLRDALRFQKRKLPLTGNGPSAGIFSVASVYSPDFETWKSAAVGGDYSKPDASLGTAAWSSGLGPEQIWTASATPPHGYRSTVQRIVDQQLWVTAGTNGSDVSRDDGKTWQPLDNGNWNALSLPFVVGPKGRIGRLNPAGLPSAE